MQQTARIRKCTRRGDFFSGSLSENPARPGRSPGLPDGSNAAYWATRATTRSGLPEPPSIFSGADMISAPWGGSWSRLHRHCRP